MQLDKQTLQVCVCVCVGGEGGELGGDDVDIEPTDTSAWAGTDRDYTYEEVRMKRYEEMDNAQM